MEIKPIAYKELHEIEALEMANNTYLNNQSLLEHKQQFVDGDFGYLWLLENQQKLAYVLIFRKNDMTMEIRRFITFKQNKGNGTRGIRALLEYLTSEYSLNIICLDVAVENTAAFKVYRKNNFIPKYFVLNGLRKEGVGKDLILMEYSNS